MLLKANAKIYKNQPFWKQQHENQSSLTFVDQGI